MLGNMCAKLGIILQFGSETRLQYQSCDMNQPLLVEFWRHVLNENGYNEGPEGSPTRYNVIQLGYVLAIVALQAKRR